MTTRDHELVTPEAVVLDLGVAGLASRTMAKLVDLVCRGIAVGLVALIAGLTAGAIGSTVVFTIVLSVGVFSVIVLLPALCETWWLGRTPGKALLGLRVVTDEGGPVSFRHAAVRGLLNVVETLTGLGMVVAVANPLNKRMGDFAAGTQVIVDRPWEAPLIPTVFFPPSGFETYTDALDVGRVTSEHFLLIRTFLLRVAELDPAARGHLAVRIAGPLRQITQPDPPPHLHPELFLICVASAFQARHGGLPERAVQPQYAYRQAGPPPSAAGPAGAVGPPGVWNPSVPGPAGPYAGKP
jgi:uncharacterized RDD family membrane protein YckC